MIHLHCRTLSPASGAKLQNAVSVLSSTSSSFGIACSNGRIGEATSIGTNGTPSAMDEVMKRAALAEEEAMYEKLKASVTLLIYIA